LKYLGINYSLKHGKAVAKFKEENEELHSQPLFPGLGAGREKALGTRLENDVPKIEFGRHYVPKYLNTA